ncbi:hypothetical protein [[Clostridium] polysaccharolyticum]|nr:hypothetical protein [[Clostridium] polysaccharolyticum]
MRNKNKWIIMDIEEANRRGLEICIDGKEYTYSDIMRRKRYLVKENADYMSDYIYDEHGKVVGIYYDKVK